jgi:hypothetical protein
MREGCPSGTFANTASSFSVVDADYLKFSAGVGDPAPYELFFEDSATASQRKRQAHKT